MVSLSCTMEDQARGYVEGEGCQDIDNEFLKGYSYLVQTWPQRRVFPQTVFSSVLQRFWMNLGGGRHLIGLNSQRG